MMKQYRVLIVDDETFVTDWIADLIERDRRADTEFDLLRAYCADEALAWFARARIDLLISDIRMPGVSGLELARRVRGDWPDCRVLFLSAYAQFEYAYEAMQLGVDGYVLKGEEDAQILARIHAALDMLEAKRRLPAEAVPMRKALLALLRDERADARQRLREAGLDAEAPGFCVMAIVGEAQRALLLAAVRDLISGIAACADGQREYWLMQLPDAEHARSVRMLGALEGAQRAMAGRCALLVSPAVAGPEVGRALRVARALPARADGYVMAFSLDRAQQQHSGERTVEWIKRYVRENIAGDVSLTRLSELTGYNASYLSRLFSETAGEPLSRFIAEEKLEAVRRLMIGTNASLSEIAVRAGFASRTYFNRFIRQYVGISPQDYLLGLRKNRADL